MLHDEKADFEVFMNMLGNEFGHPYRPANLQGFWNSLHTIPLEIIKTYGGQWKSEKLKPPTPNQLRKFIEERWHKPEKGQVRQIDLENELIRLNDEFTQFLNDMATLGIDAYRQNINKRANIEYKMGVVYQKLRSSGYSSDELNQIWEKEKAKRNARGETLMSKAQKDLIVKRLAKFGINLYLEK